MATPSTDGSCEQKRHRQAHQKSRNGCNRCKLRHRKCDEIHPQCGPCRKSASSCSFSSTSPATATMADHSSPISPQRDDNNTFSLSDLHLLHHWLKGPGLLFSDQDPATALADREHQMDLAFSHPYLLHSMLSLAALELFHHSPEERRSYYDLAVVRHLSALRHGRPNISQTSGEHAEALWCFSAFVALWSWAEVPLRALTEKGRVDDVLGELLKAFRMGRGIVSVMEVNRGNLVEAERANGVKWPDETGEVLGGLDGEFPQHKEVLGLVERWCGDGERDKVGEAVTKLFAIISLLHRRPKMHSSARLIQTWPMHVDECLYKMWEERRPVGLVILAHYAVMINLRSNIWFFERWPRLLFDFIDAELDEDWRRHVEWPRTMIYDS